MPWTASTSPRRAGRSAEECARIDWTVDLDNRIAESAAQVLRPLAVPVVGKLIPKAAKRGQLVHVGAE